MRAFFAIPGDLSAPTGGYAYARRLLRAAPAEGLELIHAPLPGSFPLTEADTLGQAEEVLAALPDGVPVLIDGLAYGAFPDGLIDAVRGPIVALCHHPLALETGLAPEVADHLRRTECTALARATHVLTTSHATAAILSQDFAVPADRVTVARPGTDPAPRAPRGDGPCRLLSVGSVTPRKGHVRLIAALAPLCALDWTLRIVGPHPDPAALADVQAAIASHGLEDHVELAGALGTPALTAAYQSSDLFVLASAYEGFGMAFTEAMSHGLPTVGLACLAVEEATAGAACLVPPEDLPATLKLLLSDAGTRDAVAERCWTAAQTFVRWPETARIVARVLKEVDA